MSGGIQRTQVTLADCPPGLFETPDGHWGFKTEYAHKSEADGLYYPDAYVVESGEFFWGGVTTHRERAKLLVLPLDAGVLRQSIAATIMWEALLAIHAREWADGDTAAGHRHAAEMWRIADHAFGAIAKIEGDA